MANELRVRQNFLGGIIEDNPLTSGATTLTSAALAAMVAIGSTQHLAITLDPDGLYGEPEIVWVTAHTAAATTATILRGQEGTTARAHYRDVRWSHGPTTRDTEQLVALQHVTLASAAASISFTGIPAGYEHLALEMMNVSAAGNNEVGIQFNGDTAANYDWVRFYGNGTTANSDGGAASTSGKLASVGAASPGFVVLSAKIPGYARTVLQKAVIATGTRLDAGTGIPLAMNYSARWRSTAAINRIDLLALVNNFDVGTSATLYAMRGAF